MKQCGFSVLKGALITCAAKLFRRTFVERGRAYKAGVSAGTFCTVLKMVVRSVDRSVDLGETCKAATWRVLDICHRGGGEEKRFRKRREGFCGHIWWRMLFASIT